MIPFLISFISYITFIFSNAHAGNLCDSTHRISILSNIIFDTKDMSTESIEKLFIEFSRPAFPNVMNAGYALGNSQIFVVKLLNSCSSNEIYRDRFTDIIGNSMYICINEAQGVEF